MDSVEVTLWMDRRWRDALEKYVLDGTVAEKLEEYIGELVNQVPENVYKKISGEIWREAQQAKLDAEAARRFAVFHVTENGTESHFLLERDVDFPHAARWVRDYLRQENRYPSRFGNQFSNTTPLTAEQFRSYASERMDNTGRVTGAFEIDLDKGVFAALHIMDGWKVYRVKDVSAAAYHAFKKQGANLDERLVRLMEKLEGKELTNTPSMPREICGSRRLRKEDIAFTDEICHVDNLLYFSLYCAFNVDEVFGTHVETEENDDYINVYANYDMLAGQACNQLEIILCLDDRSEVSLDYKLDEAELAALEARMEGYCYEQAGMGLKEYSAQLMAEEPEQTGMQGPQM